MANLRRWTWTLLLGWGLHSLPQPAVAAVEDAGQLVQSGPKLGLILDPDLVASLPGSLAEETERPFLLRLTAHWSEVETREGVYDWSRLESAVSKALQWGLSPVLCLTGTNPLHGPERELPSPLQGESMEAWVAFVRSAARTFAGRVLVYEIWDGPARPDPAQGLPAFEPEIYAFLLKNSALALRAEARAAGADALVAQGALDGPSLEWQRRVWEADTAPYVDVLPLGLSSGEKPGAMRSALAGLLAEAVQHPAAPGL